MNYVIVGCGALSQKRNNEFKKYKKINLKAIYVNNIITTKRMQKFTGCEIIENLDKYDYEKIDFALIATPHKFLVSSTLTLIKKGIRNFFIEKPGSFSLEDLERLKPYQKYCNFYFGFNHRFLKSIIDIEKIFKSKKFGNFLFLRAIYGHGGRKNYEKEWRFKKEISGGGQLIDQGIHLIDICRFLSSSKLKVDYANLSSLFWKKSIEDNTFLTLKDHKNRNYFINNSWTEWKNKFHLEVFFEKAKVEITGIGKSYGDEILKIYKMNKSLKPPKIYYKKYSYGGSIHLENKFFINLIKKKTKFNYLNSTIENWKIIKEAYHKNVNKT